MKRKISVMYLVLMLTLFFTHSWVNTAFSGENSHDRSHRKANHHEQGGIRGMVWCDTGGPVAGAVVEVQDSGLQDTTDSKGRFRIHHIPKGTYAITVTFDGTVLKSLGNVSVFKRKTTDVGKVGVACSETCILNTDCPAGSYCAKTDGSCGSSGKCEAMPAACIEIYDPVCSCDGSTFSNSCAAAQAGANVLFKGYCRITPPMPVSCTDNSQCGNGEYCIKAAGSCAGAGTCGPRASGCIQLYAPVCGCNGSTYANECEAAAAGVAVAAQGACFIPPPPPAACTDNAQCAAGEFCAKALGACTDQGSCAPRPSLCAQMVDPVCGCNGTTYPNDCEAAAAGVVASYKGLCEAPPSATGCMMNAECLSAQYCEKASGDCGGVGSCVQRPEICPMLFNPVLGCDGRSYSNSCEAASAGVNTR